MNQNEKRRNVQISWRRTAAGLKFALIAVVLATAMFGAVAVSTAKATTVSLQWDGNFKGSITSIGKWHHCCRPDYWDKHGTVTMSSLPSSYHVLFKVSETGTGRQFVGSPSAGSQTTQIPGYEAISGPLTYGTWYFAKDNSRFMFRPNHQTMDSLNTGESITTTLRVEVYNASTYQTAASHSIELTINGFPNVTISRRISRGTGQITEGETVTFTLTASAASPYPLRVDLTPSPATYLASGYRDHAVIPAGTTSGEYSLETARNKLPTGTNQATVTVTVVDGFDYELGSSSQSSFVLKRDSSN